jgi:hypothetical protein
VPGRRIVQTSKTSSFTTSPFILPYEPGYIGHWEVEKRHKQTKEWLRQREREIELRRQREREIASPPIAPDTTERVERGGLSSRYGG